MFSNTIRIIATYEMKTLLRSWFFRIFASGTIFGLGIFNIAMNVDSSGAPWIYKALASSIPYANLIILNLGQAIVAVFLASEFLKQDRKNDTVEVIYARPMSNGQYIAGKTLGILTVFLLLNFIILLMGIGFSFLGSVSSQRFFAYLAYPLLISLPTLVYILGLSFFVMTLVKNQAVTFIILTGYIAITVFYLNKKAYHLFDYIAYQVPMMYSSISGFGNTGEIVLHRGIYLVLGIALIMLTVYKLPRLAQTVKYHRMPLWGGLILLAAGILMAYAYLNNKNRMHSFRNQVIALNNAYAHYPRAITDSCMLDVEHLGNSLSVKATLYVSNHGAQPVDTLIMSLNPDLEVSELRVDSKPLAFTRKKQLILAILPETLEKTEALTINLHYFGSINEGITFLDQSEEEFDKNPAFEVFRLRKRTAFLQRNFVCLTAESLWYPITGTGYASALPARYEPDFTRFSLKVKTRPGLVILSQGKMDKKENGQFTFSPEFALSKITLLIGKYIENTLTVDSVAYSIFSMKGHDYYKPYFTSLADTLPTLIRELKKEYETNVGMEYPFRRLMLAEVPVHFSLDHHLYAYACDAIQPEMILYPEKGVLFNSSDFKARTHRLEKNAKNNNEEVIPVDIQKDLFNRFVKDNFLAQRGQRFNYDELVNWQTYSVFPQYLTFITRLASDRWPVLGLSFETYIGERNNKAGNTMQWYDNLSANEKINLELAQSSLGELMATGIEKEAENEENPVTLRDVIQVKGIHFFNLLRARYGESQLDTLLTGLIDDHRHKPIPFEELNGRFNQKFNQELASEVGQWYEQKNLPGFIIGKINTYKVMQDDNTRYQIRFTLSNPEPADGMVTLNVEMNDPNRKQNDFGQGDFNVDFSRQLFLPAKTSFEVGYIFNTEPARMSIVTHISKNLPYNLVYGFEGFNEIRNADPLDDAVPIPFFETINHADEVVADNEDDDFSFLQTTDEAYLRSVVQRNSKKKYKYSAIWAWSPPREWRSALRSEFYGRYIHSAHYTRAGSGERTATWKARLPEKGAYDVFFYMDKVNVGWRRSNRSPDYNITVYHDHGAEKINQVTEDIDHGWHYLGTWYISSDTAKVELTNKSGGDMIFADAVKWVLSHE
ncbi:MAG: hypothetical protein JXQ80_05690 [Bacteroidales bacterium]|nr:hypothetical protein [Bacteroidales bacterium]